MIPLRDDQPCFSTPFITYFLIALNILVFLFELSPAFQTRGELNALLFQFGVVPRHEIALLTGTPVFSPGAALFPIVTSMFLHASLAHIVGNMWVLWLFGDNIEDNFGHIKFLVFYLICGIAATFAQLVFSVGSNVPNLGASGAIAGVLGAYIVMFPKGQVRVLMGTGVIPMPALVVIGLWIVLQFISGVGSIANTSATGGVAYMAHIGGFLAGVVLTFLFRATGTTQETS